MGCFSRAQMYICFSGCALMSLQHFNILGIKMCCTTQGFMECYCTLICPLRLLSFGIYLHKVINFKHWQISQGCNKCHVLYSKEYIIHILKLQPIFFLTQGCTCINPSSFGRNLSQFFLKIRM